MSKHFEFIVLGGGSAGYAAARIYRQTSESVAVVDSSAELGGLCILRGCMPSKTLLYIAEVLHHARHGSIFGLDIPSAKADMAAVHERKKKIIGEFADYRAEQLQSGNFHLFRQSARFVDGKTIRLDDGTELTADAFLVSTGSLVSFPPLPGLEPGSAMTSNNVLDLDHLPESVIVLGGGVVACELTQFLNRMGSKVVQIQRSPLILREASTSSAEVVMQAFRDEGIELHTGTRITGIERIDDVFRVTFETDGREVVKEAVYLFNALGRKPNTTNLGLENAGVERLPSGHINTNSVQQSTNPIIYAAGDAAGPHEIVHVAILQGEVAARHAAGLNPEPVNYDHLTKIIFTDPQIAATGMAETELQDKNIPYSTADYPFDDHGKSILMEAKYGYVKIWADPSRGIVLGAECVGKDACELIHSMAVAVALEATVFDLLKAHWYHPTLSEIWTYPIEEIADAITARNKKN